MSKPPKNVTIIGAGLGGLTLALSLHKFGIQSKLVELRAADYGHGGAIMMSPNSLRVLDHVDAYEAIKILGFSFKTLTFKTDQDQKTTGTYYFGDSESYEYDGLRIYRNELLVALRKLALERGIPIEYGKRFSHVVSEDDHGVKYALADGSIEEAEILIGADGIHSKVRKYLEPEVEALYSGFIGVTYAFPRSMVKVPTPDYPMPVSIHGQYGAFVMAPQLPDGSEIFVGRQFPYQPQDRLGWDALQKDTPQLIELHQNNMPNWSGVIQSGQLAASSPEAHSFNIWPYHTMPKMNTWGSKLGKIILIGDAAHAIPPSAGQGANQAFEDSYSLALLLKSLGSNVDAPSALTKWQQYRQARVDKVLQLSGHIEVLRLSDEEKKSLPAEKLALVSNYDIGVNGQLAWLYSNKIEDDMNGILNLA